MSVINSAVVLITLTQPCWQLPCTAPGTWGLLTAWHKGQNLSVMVPVPFLSLSHPFSLKLGHPQAELMNAAVDSYISHPPSAHIITISAWLELSPTLQQYPHHCQLWFSAVMPCSSPSPLLGTTEGWDSGLGWEQGGGGTPVLGKPPLFSVPCMAAGFPLRAGLEWEEEQGGCPRCGVCRA